MDMSTAQALWVDFKVWVSTMHRQYDEDVHWNRTTEWYLEVKPLQDKETNWYREFSDVTVDLFEADMDCYEQLIMPAVYKRLEICIDVRSNPHSNGYNNDLLYNEAIVDIGNFERKVEERLHICPRIPHPPASPVRHPSPCRECKYQPKDDEDAYQHLCEDMKPGIYR